MGKFGERRGEASKLDKAGIPYYLGSVRVQAGPSPTLGLIRHRSTKLRDGLILLTQNRSLAEVFAICPGEGDLLKG